MAAHLIHPGLVGAYVYAITVDGVVRYIGKGRRYRALEHFRYARLLNEVRATGAKVAALPVHNKLAKALRNGAALDYLIVANGLGDEAAFERERQEIEKQPAGQLWNVKPGGRGESAEFMASLWRTPEFLASVRRGRQSSRNNEQFKENARAKAVAQWETEGFREAWMRQHRAIWDDPEAAAERRALLKAVWADPEKTERKRALVKSQWTPERRAAMSENRRRAWADPEFKARASANIRAAKAK